MGEPDPGPDLDGSMATRPRHAVRRADPEAFADTPLFREIQRVLPPRGPVNWELARQVGIAAAQEAQEDPDPGDEDRRGVEEAVRVAELQVARLHRPRAAGRRAAGAARPAGASGCRRTSRGCGAARAGRDARRRRARAQQGAARSRPRPARETALAAAAAAVGACCSRRCDARPRCSWARRSGSRARLPRAARARAVRRRRSRGRDPRRAAVRGPEHRALRDAIGASTAPSSERCGRASTRSPTGSSSPSVGARRASATLLEDFLSTLQIDVDGLQRRIGALDPSDPEAMQAVGRARRDCSAPSWTTSSG